MSGLTEDVFEVLQARRPDDGRRHAGLAQNPRHRDLRHANAFLLRELLNPVEITPQLICRSAGETSKLVPADECREERLVEECEEAVLRLLARWV